MSDNTGKAQIKAYAERIIRLEDEAVALKEDLKEVRSEAKSNGFNTKVLNAAIKFHRMTSQQRQEAEQFQMELDLYVDAIEGLSDD
jgi:uncharacterized protein (UPF0335 family)